MARSPRAYESRRMHPQRTIGFIVSTLAALCACAAWATPAAKATPADLAAFVKALPATGETDRVFLAPTPDLQARLGIDPAALRTVDPGLACDPADKTPLMVTATLGRAGSVQTLCTPGGASVSFLTLADGSSWSANCGSAGLQLHASADLTVGEHSVHASTDSPASARAPSHACKGWVKQPR